MTALVPSSLRRALVGALLLPLTLASCVDAPSAPAGSAGPPFLALAPVFSLVGPDGPALSEGQEGALAAAFDRVDRFRMVVRRASDNTVVLETVLTVTPGEEEYDLSVDIQARDNEQFLVTLTALQGDTELFKAENIPAKATPSGVPGAPAPTPVQIPLTYSGPGATATAVNVGPAQVVLAPGASATVGASVLDQGGAVIAGVTLGWTVTPATGVASVDAAGQVTASGEGVAVVTATSPTGLAASATVYVVAGELAYVEGGALKVRGVAGGSPAERGTGASQPSWSADGAQLFYVSGGQVTRAGGGALVAGAWPSLSPDGTKLAVERDGRVMFANADGSRVTAGPSGSAPVWLDAAHLLVGGGSVQRIRADGTSPTPVAPGSYPALAADGRVASTVGGELRVAGSDAALVTGAVGRATWSPNGRWLVVGTAAGLVLVPSDGSAPPVALPGLVAAGDPAWKRAGVVTAPPEVTVTGFNPDPPIPGKPVLVQGSGFDWIIPGNNRVVWPTRGGETSTAIDAVAEDVLSTVMPRDVVAGNVRVEAGAATALLAFTPTVGSLEVTATTPWGAAVEGVGLALAGSDGTQSAPTGPAGGARFDGLIPGTYTLTITPPSGYTLTGDAVRSLGIGADLTTLALTLTPGVGAVTLSPAAPTLAVGGSLPVTLVVTDVNGQPIPQVPDLAWASASAELGVTPGSGLSATLSGIFAGEASGSSTLQVTAYGTTYTFPVTVSSRIGGAITASGAAAAGVTVELKRAGTVVASTTTGSDGRYAFTGLFQGTYDVVPRPDADRLPVPEGQTVTLDQANPTGTADFVMQSFAGLDVSATTPWEGGVAGVAIAVADAQGVQIATGETDDTGALSFPRLSAGAVTLSITVPTGFDLSGPSSRSLTLQPGNNGLDLTVTPIIQSVTTVPEVISVAVGGTATVQVVPLDARGRIIPQVTSARWFTLSGHLAAGGVGLEGQLGGVYPSSEGGAQVGVELNGRVFNFPATVTSHINGAVTRSTDSGSQPVSLVTVVAELNGQRVAETASGADGAYRIAGLTAGTYTLRAIAPEGKAASPTSHSVTLGQGNPTGIASFTISDVPTGSAGEVLVLGDINYWGSSSYYIEQANNKEMTRNLVTNGSRNRTVWYFGHNTYNYSLYNESYFFYAATYIRNTVGRTLEIVDNTTTGGLNLPMDANSWWFWMPQAAFDAHDIGVIQQYLAGGGRVILVGENNNSVFNLANQRVQELMNALGSAGTYMDSCLAGIASEVTADPLTADITSIQTNCSSYVAPGSGDVPLIKQGGQSVLTRIRLGAAVSSNVPTPFTPGLLQTAPAPGTDPSLGPSGGR